MISNVILSYYSDSDTISLVHNYHEFDDIDDPNSSEYLVKCSGAVLFSSSIREKAEKYFFGLYMESCKPSKLF